MAPHIHGLHRKPTDCCRLSPHSGHDRSPHPWCQFSNLWPILEVKPLPTPSSARSIVATACRTVLFLIVVVPSPAPSGLVSASFSASNAACPLHITRRRTAVQSGSTQSLKLSCASTSTTRQTTGTFGYRIVNLPSTATRPLPLA